jgi:glycosyltransferase involved in cell wall biosynthesis
VIGEHTTCDGAPVHRPRGRTVDEVEPAHEDLVDAALERRREAGRHGSNEVRVAGDDRPVVREREDAVKLLASAVDVEVHDGHVGDLDHVRDAPQLRVAHDMGPEIRCGLAREDRVRFPGHRRPEKPVVEIRHGARAEWQQRAPRDGRGCMHAAPALELVERPDRQLLEADDVRAVARYELDHLTEESLALGRGRVSVEEVPCPHEHGHGVAYGAVRVLLADPPAFTPPYDHELAAALARAGADVELVTSRFRFGGAPEPDGYRRRELFYPLSSRVFGRSPLRLPVKVAEHPLGLAALRRIHADVLHMQWLPAPELDAFLFRPHLPAVFTAHDLLPRRTAHRTELWRRLFARFERIVVHSENGRQTLAELGVERERLRVIPHPVFPSEPERRDDGRTVLAFGMIRPYKGLGDAIEAVRRAGDARLLVAGDALEPLEPYRAAANGLEVEWRLGYLSPEESDHALGEATVAVFPYRPELDQSGALLRVLGAGVPAVAYDVGGIAEPVRRFEAGRVVPAGDVAGLATAVHELLDDPAALERARAGARRAREELTWDAAARAHLELYEEIA